MTVLQGLHGTVAILVLCGLLFVDEAGIPLPLVPNEVLLLVAGLLIADGSLVPWIFVPVATATMIAGMIAGYLWARKLGQTGLRAIAERVGAAEVYDRAQARLSSASSISIGLARMVPGVRPYATLVSGAAQVELRTFLLGAIPALLVWELILLGLGALIGVPVEHLMGRFTKLLVRGGLLLGLGLIGFVGLRRLNAREPLPTRWQPARGRLLLELVINGAIAASIATGLLAIGRRIVHLHGHGWTDLAIILAAVAVYLAATQGGTAAWRYVR